MHSEEKRRPATHWKFGNPVKFTCCCIQIDAGNILHLRKTRDKEFLAITNYTLIHVVVVSLQKETQAPTCCVIAEKSTLLAVAEKSLSWVLSSVLRRVTLDRVMSALSKLSWI